MTPGEQAARDGLGASVRENRHQTAITEESRRLLADLIEERMRIAVADGFKAVITSDQVWDTVFSVLQQQATKRTGQFVLGGLTALLKKVAWAGLFLLVAYSVGGWAFVKVLWAAMTKGAQ